LKKAASSTSFETLEGFSDERTSQEKLPNGSGFTYFDAASQAGGMTLLARATPAGSKI
jgi:hypothetical protein